MKRRNFIKRTNNTENGYRNIKGKEVMLSKKDIFMTRCLLTL